MINKAKIQETLNSDIPCAPQREKHWSELTADEKLERMRDQFKHLARDLSALSVKVSRMQDMLFIHQHADNGSPVIPLDRGVIDSEPGGAFRGNGLLNPNAGSDDVYF